ncbi:MAG: hypothetical protein K2P33_01175, partial [Acutalibacter sp.]|nr:hypothetical protein [Acutalibacter sp.]
IYGDREFTDQLYLSKLIPPGNAIREIVLDHSVAPGESTVYVVYTQVDDDHATIHGQVAVTMTFNVGVSE